MVVVINGSGGVGKSTFIELCREVDNSVFETSAVDFVKEIAKICGWDGTKTEENRKFLSDLKDLLSKWADVPRYKVDEIIRLRPDSIIFVNSREPEDIEYFKKKHGALTLLIENPRVPQITSNHADANVYDYKYDLIVYNDGTVQDLKMKAKKLLTMIGVVIYE